MLPDIVIGDAVTLINAVRLDDDPTTTTSTAVDVYGYKEIIIETLVDSTLAPTDVVFQLQFSNDDGVNFATYNLDYWANYRYEDTATASGLREVAVGRVLGKKMQFVATATGTSGTAFFDVSAWLVPIHA